MVRVVGIGDLVTDIYYNKGKFIGACGGKTFANICANLAFMGVNTSIIGVCGNDLAGVIAVHSLEYVNVDISNITVKNIKTRLFHIDEFKTTKKCPCCNKETWYSNSQINSKDAISKILKEDIIVVDNLNKSIIEIIDNITNKVVIDIGYYNAFIYMEKDEILKLIQSRFDIINMNERVYLYLIKKFQLNSPNELYLLLKTNILIITKGSVGADFVFNNKVITKNILNKGEEIDANGAGDAFLAVFLKEYIVNNFIINDSFIETSFQASTLITKKVVEEIGARGHLTKLYNMENRFCSCKDNTVANCQVDIKAI